MAKTKADLEREVAELRAKLKKQEAVPPKERQAVETRANLARKAVEGVTVEAVVQDLAKVGLDTGRALSSLSETLTAKTKQLEDLDAAIRVKTEDLETLVGKEAVVSSLAALVEEHDQQKEAFAKTVEETRRAWDKEQQDHLASVAERDAELAKARAREQDEYNYARAQERRAAETLFQNALADQNRVEAFREEDFNRLLATREAAMKAKETEMEAALARIEGLPAEIDTAVKREVAAATGAMAREHKHATELAARDHATVVAALKAEVAAVATENSRLLAQVADLATKLDAAYAKNVSLSEKALDSASGRQALSELRDLQMTSNTGTKAKA